MLKITLKALLHWVLKAQESLPGQNLPRSQSKALQGAVDSETQCSESGMPPSHSI